MTAAIGGLDRTGPRVGRDSVVGVGGVDEDVAEERLPGVAGADVPVGGAVGGNHHAYHG